MENEKSIFGLQLTNNLRDELSTLVTWARIIGVCGFISVGVSVIEVLQKPSRLGFESLAAVLTLVTSILLMLFATKVDSALKTDNTKLLASGFNKLVTYFILGVIFIFVIIIVAIAAIIMYSRFI
jgi:hypothetical protein